MKKSNLIFGLLFLLSGLSLIVQYMNQPDICTETRGAIICGMPVFLAGVSLFILGVVFFVIHYKEKSIKK